MKRGAANAAVREAPRFLNAYYDDNAVVWVARDRGGSVVLKRMPVRSTVFFAAADVDTSTKHMLRNDSRVTAMRVDGQWLRVEFRDRHFAESVCEAFEKRGIKTYEGTISPVRCLAADHDVQVARPRRAYLDLETDSRVPFSRKEEMRILCWSLADEHGVATSEILLDDDDAAERVLLGELWAKLDAVDQVLAWNGDRFDFPVLLARTKRCGLTPNHKRILWLDHLELFKRMNTMAAESGDEKTSYALNSIAMAVLGEGKDAFDASKTWQAWSTPECLNGLCMVCSSCMRRYCEKDTVLLHRLEVETGYVELLQTLCEACGTFPDSRGINPTNQAENMLLRIARKRGHRFRTRFLSKVAEGGQYKGAFVMEPQSKGVLTNVHVCDFKSLYPSIILSWNISSETRVVEPLRPMYLKTRPARQSNECEAATGTRFRTDVEGILPHAIAEVLRLREHWSRLKDSFPPGTHQWKDADRRSTAYKIAANSFYGIVGSPMSRFYDRDVAEAVTQCGVYLIKQTADKARNAGFFVEYIDTDGAFAMGCSRDEFELFVACCNAELYPKLLVACGCKENNIKLAYEKQFGRLVFVGAKKYAGSFVHYKGKDATADSKPEVKGLEYKRGDSSRLARRLQSEIVGSIIVRGEGADESLAIVDKWRRHVLVDPIDITDVSVAKTLSKPLTGYTRKTKKDGNDAKLPAHVEIALLLRARGRDVGEGAKIAYYCVDGSTSPKQYKPAEDWTGDCDRYDQWETFVWPPTKRLLESAFPEHDWSVWDKVRPKRQRTTRTKSAKHVGQLSMLGK